MPKYVPHRSVYEHEQDGAHDCGRACVQMVISSLVLGPPTGTPPGPADAKIPIPFTQDQLRQRELNPIDQVSVASWKTHPDELLALLTTAPELPAPLQDWRVSLHNSEGGLFLALAGALRDGMPAVLNLYSQDHWAVVVGAGVDVGGALEYIEVLDPLPPQGNSQHTYIDDCSGEGLTVADPVRYDITQLANLELIIGDIPNRDLTDYSGRYLMVVHGPDRRKFDPKKWRKHANPPPWDPLVQLTPVVDQDAINTMRERLMSKAHAWNITRLSALLASPTTQVARIVRDINGTLAPYYLLSVFSLSLGDGVVGAFHVSDHAPLHFRFTKNRKFEESLELRPGEMLWWTRDFLPTLRSPYFPFARTLVGNKFHYQRLFDSFTFQLDA